MNKLEAQYALEVLDDMVSKGEAVLWIYESVKLKLAPNTFYTPDFMVILKTGEVAFREVKGFLRDDAAVKFKWARRAYPFFSFQMWERRRGQWQELLPESSP